MFKVNNRNTKKVFLWLIPYPANIYLLKFNKRNTKKCELSSNLTIKTPGTYLLTLNIFHTYFYDVVLQLLLSRMVWISGLSSLFYMPLFQYFQINTHRERTRKKLIHTGAKFELLSLVFNLAWKIAKNNDRRILHKFFINRSCSSNP